jgi:hypothetical protein
MASGVLTGTMMIKTKFIEGRIQELTDGYLITDKIFSIDNTDALSIVYEDPDSRTPSDESQVEERTELGNYPRVGMSTQEKSAMIKDYGLSVLLSWNAITKNQISSINRAYIKLANSMMKFVDGLGLKVLTDNYNGSSTKIHTKTAGVAWSTTATSKPFDDLMLAKAKVNGTPGESYMADVALIHPEDMTNALLNENFRKELDTDLSNSDKIVRSGILRGKVAGLLLIEANNITKGNIWVGEREMVGTRHQNTNGVESDSYKQDNSKKSAQVVSSFREFVDVLNEPKAGCLITGV